MSSEELNVALSRFVREVCRPSGERYSPDSILYLCLGIQQVSMKRLPLSRRQQIINCKIQLSILFKFFFNVHVL